jgi:hypothetical protein
MGSELGRQITAGCRPTPWAGGTDFVLAGRQDIVRGTGARVMGDEEQDLALFAFLPPHRLLDLFSGFLEDEISPIPRELRLTVGSELEHSVAWTPDGGDHTLPSRLRFGRLHGSTTISNLTPMISRDRGR